MSETWRFRILYALIALSLAPCIFLVRWPVSWSLAPQNLVPVAQYAGSVAGFMGLALLLWMYVLGTRSVSGLYFRDLPKVLHLHNLLGTYGVLLVFAHPLLQAYAYGENLIMYAIVPNLGTAFETYVTYGRIALWALLILWVTSALIRGRIAYRPWKYIHYLAYIAIILSLLHIPRIGTSFTELATQWYWYSLLYIFFVCSVLRLRHLFGFGKYLYEIVDHRTLAANAAILRLRPRGTRIAALPGQYIYLQRRMFGEDHPFSVLMHDATSGDIWIAYKKVGAYTNAISRLTPGAAVLVDGGYGYFTQSDHRTTAADPTIYIAGGIGITPFYQSIMQADYTVQPWLFYANRTKAHRLFADTLRARLGDRYVDVLSAETTPAGSHDERGLITAAVLKTYLGDVRAAAYYICGPPAMMRAVTDELVAAGVSKQRIHTEDFSL